MCMSTSCTPTSSHVNKGRENLEEITTTTGVMAAGTGQTIVASEIQIATDMESGPHQGRVSDVESRATPRPCVGLVTKINTTRKVKGESNASCQMTVAIIVMTMSGVM